MLLFYIDVHIVLNIITNTINNNKYCFLLIYTHKFKSIEYTKHALLEI